jgi:hypothetical protein
MGERRVNRRRGASDSGASRGIALMIPDLEHEGLCRGECRFNRDRRTIGERRIAWRCKALQGGAVQGSDVARLHHEGLADMWASS